MACRTGSIAFKKGPMMPSTGLTVTDGYRTRFFSKLKNLKLDVWILMLVTALLNLHLVGLQFKPIPVFSPTAISAGEWWRVVAHPFVHVSWYHLTLDAGAFFLLYSGLKTLGMGQRLFALFMCIISSLLAAIWFVENIDVVGLCGLSGAAHGLMALSGLEMIQLKKFRSIIGILSFVAVTLKSIVEFFSGQVVFDFMHMGLCGIPLAACHLGGVAGGVGAFFLLNLTRKSGLD